MPASFDPNAADSGSIKPIDLPLRTLLELSLAYRPQRPLPLPISPFPSLQSVWPHLSSPAA